MKPPQKNSNKHRSRYPQKQNIFYIFQNWAMTLPGMIILIGSIALAVEIFIVELVARTAPLFHISVSGFYLHILSAGILTLVITPILYFLIFRRVSSDAEKFLKITSAAQDAVIVMDNNGNISFWNNSAERIFGYSAEEAMGKDLHLLIAPSKSLNAFETNFHHFQKTGEGPILNLVREIVAQRKSGEQFHAELSVSAMLIDGRWHAVGIVRDTTDRKKREAALRERDLELAEANQKLANEKATDEAILESLGEGLVATDKLGNIIAINRVAETMTGWKKEEILNKKVLDIIPATDERGEAIPAEKRPVHIALTTGTPAIIDSMNLIKKGDGTTPVAATATPIKLNNEMIGAVLIFRDITKEQELEVTRRDLLSLASHQLRTPLSGTKWLIETLKNKLHGPLTQKQEEYLEQIYNINESMTELVHDMLGVLRMEGDITEAKKEDVSLATLFGVIFETLGSAAKSKNIKLSLAATDEYMIKTDPLLLRQILECLVSNAINYSPNGSEVLVAIKQSAGEMIFMVKDSGIGIPADEQRQIFQRFYRATNAKTYDTRGTGLGLYIAATLAKKINARISFESEKDKGTTFYVYVPLSHN